MKILFADLEREWRGGQSQALLTLLGLRERGHTVELLAAEGSPLAERVAQAGIVVRTAHRLGLRAWAAPDWAAIAGEAAGGGVLVVALSAGGGFLSAPGVPLGGAVGAAIAISPWVIRNQRALGAPILLRDNLGLELAVAFNDTVGVTMYETDRNGTYNRVHPNVSPEQALRVRTGETGPDAI